MFRLQQPPPPPPSCVVCFGQCQSLNPKTGSHATPRMSHSVLGPRPRDGQYSFVLALTDDWSEGEVWVSTGACYGGRYRGSGWGWVCRRLAVNRRRLPHT